MTPSARIQATLELLESIEATPRPADAITSAYFRARRYIGSKDRADISTRLYAVLRHWARLGWWLEKQQAAQPPRARLLGWLALGEEMPLKAIGELCSGGKYAPAPLNDGERDFLRKMQGATIEHPDMPDDIKAECPADCAGALRKKFGKNFLREMRAMLAPATLDLRVNPLKSTREDMLAELEKLGLKAEACKLSPWGIRVFERANLSALPMLKNGCVEIQDEGSQMVATVVDARPGERVMDFCAGAGGKTLAIAATMKNKGRIIACDVMEGRLKRSVERFRRAGVYNVETRVLKSERDPWIKKHKGGFDRVLCDAPCSGTGTWRRNPDARWRPLGPGLEKLLHTQAEILDSAARLVKAGGFLIYSTCSLLPSENEEQIEKFLAAHPDFTREDCGLDGAAYLSLTPAKHNTDGFFAAALKRQATSDKGSAKGKSKAAATEG
ncbi:MAG: RsmB/NOP family class I SAM-dependent RNA methyltransferase [Alphaproteobacteria bacterium]|nr:RsmB/NOP family class I SAM-dependent RNA methyltransferase [Alphaproteobacteria bacterium]